MGFQRLLHTETGRIIISIVLGLGIASLFRKVCKDRSCIAFRAPPLKDLEKGFENYLKNDDVKNRKDAENLKKQIYSSLYC